MSRFSGKSSTKLIEKVPVWPWKPRKVGFNIRRETGLPRWVWKGKPNGEVKRPDFDEGPILTSSFF